MLADSHIHLFRDGYKSSQIDELNVYKELMKEFAISSALVIGYEGSTWAEGNNEYLSSILPANPWMHCLGYVRLSDLDQASLLSLEGRGFEGISLYIDTELDQKGLLAVEGSTWNWLVSKKWIISINSRSHLWRLWEGILEEFPDLILLISHLGMPKNDIDSPALIDLQIHFDPIARLMRFENVYLKISGLYALEPTTPVYPYISLNPYLAHVFSHFNPGRLTWGSDFFPAMASVNLRETYEYLKDSDLLNFQTLSGVLHDNLTDLLGQVESPNSENRSEK